TVLASVEKTGDCISIDASSRLVTPGFVDPHTHLVFGGNRANEFMMRCQGKSYSEIAEAGGGIVASMRGTRKASKEELVELGLVRLERMLAAGTTTCEVKTGYGLDQESEIRMLEAIFELDERQPIDLVPTFLPAHAVPTGTTREEYVNEVVEKILPAALTSIKKFDRAPDSVYVDVFCDQGYFSLDDTKRIFDKALKLGLKLKVHSDEFKSLGATALAAEMGAASADHLLTICDEDMEALARSNTIGVLLPGTSFFLNLSDHAPARTMIDRGVAIAVGSDFNPGSCHIFSMPLIMGLACLHLGLTAEEALSATTINSAHAVGRGDTIGQLAHGYQADIAIWDLAHLEEIPYNMGWNAVCATIKNGVVAHQR
ncbi:MAG TPA: imidazolonepropionase, partial [Candidatus Melainabacteria bacterium]|nr:imidazolonepropionase [Candidatus Melainabacteria bacterium]